MRVVSGPPSQRVRVAAVLLLQGTPMILIDPHRASWVNYVLCGFKVPASAPMFVTPCLLTVFYG